jgi:hypothetical protein
LDLGIPLNSDFDNYSVGDKPVEVKITAHAKQRAAQRTHTKDQINSVPGAATLIEPGKGFFETYAVYKSCSDEMAGMFQ